MSVPKTPSFRLDGRRALVTGGGRGIGLACAAAFAEAGAEVVLTARGSEEIENAAAEIQAAGGKAEAVVLDVTDLAATRDFIAARGPFRVLVNNAGSSRHAHFLDLTEEDYNAVADLNIKAALFAAREVANGLIKAGLPGSIINISSQMGHVGGPERSVYCATKHAVEGFTKAMAWELGQHDIRINTICPTFILTRMTQASFDDPEKRAWIESKIALGRVGRIEDIMGAALYLASDASAMVTGSALMVDGGWTAA
ncbi:MAG: glucose 1-dehydrogenase [Pseudomonadota bacterium]